MTVDIGILWAAILDSLEVDLLDQSVTVRAHVEGPSPSKHVLRITDVRSLHFTNSIPGPWNYAEITECRVNTAGEGVKAELILWADECRLEVLGFQATFDGVGVP